MNSNGFLETTITIEPFTSRNHNIPTHEELGMNSNEEIKVSTGSLPFLNEPIDRRHDSMMSKIERATILSSKAMKSDEMNTLLCKTEAITYDSLIDILPSDVIKYVINPYLHYTRDELFKYYMNN